MVAMHTHNRSKRGFTLIELLIVIGIIAVLAGLLFTNFSGARERARDITRKSDLAQLKNALRLYYNDYQTYPADNGSGKMLGCGADHVSLCSAPNAFSAGAGPTIYMNQLPKDPLDPAQTYTYSLIVGTNGDTFTLTATLENASDDSSATSQAKCGVTPPTANIYMVCSD